VACLTHASRTRKIPSGI